MSTFRFFCRHLSQIPYLSIGHGRNPAQMAKSLLGRSFLDQCLQDLKVFQHRNEYSFTKVARRYFHSEKG